MDMRSFFFWAQGRLEVTRKEDAIVSQRSTAEEGLGGVISHEYATSLFRMSGCVLRSLIVGAWHRFASLQWPVVETKDCWLAFFLHLRQCI